MAEPQPLFDYTGYLPECPTWSEAEQALYWADIMECEIHRYDIRSGEHQVLQFPEEVGCFALREKGGFIVALRSGIWLTDAHGLLRRKVCDNPSNPELARFNDGGTDRDGRFYAGTFWGPGDYNGALLMRVDNDLQPKVIDLPELNPNITRPDGIAVVLALEIVPNPQQAFITNEPGDINTHITSTRETQDVFILRREAVISPFLDESLPLVW